VNGFVRFIAWIAGIFGAFCVILYIGVLDVWVTPTDDPQFVVSIEPTLSGGDTVLILRHGIPSVPDLVRCSDPDAPGRFVVGRIVGGGKDKVDVGGESLTINKSHTPSPRACSTPKVLLRNPATGEDQELDCSQQEFGGITFDALRLADHPEPGKVSEVPVGKVYLVSDNRHMHLDSRDFNAVDPDTCRHIVARLWSKHGWPDGEHRLSYIP
jgi:signal peptidase I